MYIFNPLTNSVEKREDLATRVRQDLKEQRRIDDKTLLLYGEKQQLLAKYA